MFDFTLKISFEDKLYFCCESNHSSTYCFVQSALGDGYKIAYIDIKDDQTEGYIRCENAESAKHICSNDVSGYTFTSVTGTLISF